MEMKLLAVMVIALPLLALGCANENRQPSQGEPAEQMRGRFVRIAELEIDPAQLENYKAELREEIEASIRLEPGVLTLYAVSLNSRFTN